MALLIQIKTKIQNIVQITPNIQGPNRMIIKGVVKKMIIKFSQITRNLIWAMDEEIIVLKKAMPKLEIHIMMGVGVM